MRSSAYPGGQPLRPDVSGYIRQRRRGQRLGFARHLVAGGAAQAADQLLAILEYTRLGRRFRPIVEQGRFGDGLQYELRPSPIQAQPRCVADLVKTNVDRYVAEFQLDCVGQQPTGCTGFGLEDAFAVDAQLDIAAAGVDAESIRARGKDAKLALPMDRERAGPCAGIGRLIRDCSRQTKFTAASTRASTGADMRGRRTIGGAIFGHKPWRELVGLVVAGIL